MKAWTTISVSARLDPKGANRPRDDIRLFDPSLPLDSERSGRQIFFAAVAPRIGHSRYFQSDHDFILKPQVPTAAPDASIYVRYATYLFVGGIVATEIMVLIRLSSDKGRWIGHLM